MFTMYKDKCVIEKRRNLSLKRYIETFFFVKNTIIKGPVFILNTLSAAQNEWYVDP